MRRLALAAVALSAIVAAPAHGFDYGTEGANFAKTQERQAIYQSPEGQLQLRLVSQANGQAALQAGLDDPERQFFTDLCWSYMDGCAGDPRLYDWAAKGYGIVRPVLFTARNGATISGHVWATKAGPAKRPGVVITNGSVQASEPLYWFAAQTLAKAGYVVLTWDPQGQGQSDTRGEAPDENEGFPAQSDGRPFFDGTQDALDFFFSTPQQPFVPRPSCESGTSHAPKQDRRAAAGLNAAFNPFHDLLDPERVGVAGHSYGAAGVSYVGQADPRVDAIVAWDNLGGADPDGREQPCPADPSQREPKPLTKPALGMSADYGLTPQPNTADPAPLGKSTQSLRYSEAGIDTGQLNIRGGTHYEFSFIANPAFGGTLRGADMVAWYTTAWFDKYVKQDATADRRLLTDRWRNDTPDSQGDPNLFSFYLLSRLDFHRADGTRFTCEDVRAGCPGFSADDGVDGPFSYLAAATAPDGEGTATGSGIRAKAKRKKRCTSRRRIVIHLPKAQGQKILRVRATVRKRVVGRSRSRRVVVRLHGLPKTTAKVKLRVTSRINGRTVRHTVVRVYRTCRPKSTA